MNDPTIRIPVLPTGKMVDDNGNPTDIELFFRQNLISSLQNNFGDEGLVAPTQPTTNITTIQNNVLPNGEFSTPGGVFIYDSTTNTIKVSILVGGVPTFKTITVS